MRKLYLLLTFAISLMVLAGCNKKAEGTANDDKTVKASESAVVSAEGSSAKKDIGSTIKVPILTSTGYDKLLNDNKGKIIVLNFFGSWCPPCRKETPYFVSTYEKYKDKNFVIIGVAVDGNIEDVVQFVKDFNVTYPMYIANNDLIQRFNVYNIPVSQIIDKNGKIVKTQLGEISESLLEKIAKAGE